MRQLMVFLLILLTSIIQACALRNAPIAQAQPSESQEAVTKISTSPSPDLVINSKQAQREGTIVVHLNQVVAITPPSEPKQWRITYAESVLELLTPKEDLENPEITEWLFRAAATGSTDIQLTSIPPVCTDPLPCPPAPPQVITFTLEVK